MAIRASRTGGVVKPLVEGNLRVLILLLIPILVIAVVNYPSLLGIWNQGRGGLLFAVAFLAMEMRGSWLPIRGGPLTKLFSLLLVVIASLYFVAAELSDLDFLIEETGRAAGIQIVSSWLVLWDYIIFSLFILSILSISFGPRVLRIMPSANVYLTGMALILALDALFPFDTLGPLQAVVPIILNANAGLVDLLGLGDVSLSGNVLTLYGAKGSFSFAVFWPSAGVHSMLIYSLIMLLLLVKLNTSLNRKLLYLAIGGVGTFIVNTLRILLLSAYVLLVSTDPVRFQEFHALAGELVFLPWIVAYVFVVSKIESRATLPETIATSGEVPDSRSKERVAYTRGNETLPR